MKIKFYIGFIFFSAIFSGQIMAKNLDRHHAPQGIRESYIKCINQETGIAWVNGCMTEESVYQEHRLKKNYQLLLKKLNKKDKLLLISAQRAWLKFYNEEQKMLDAENIYPVLTQTDNTTLFEWNLYRVCIRANQLAWYISTTNLYETVNKKDE